VAKSRVVHAFSAGGVVFRRLAAPPLLDAAEPISVAARARAPLPDPQLPAEMVLVGYPREGIWVLPKGTPSEGESPTQTALREVREETGIHSRIIGDLGSIEYWFARKGVRFHKEVAHFLMLAMGGDVSLHDHEYDEARWFPLADALRTLTHENEAQVVRRAEPLIASWLADPQQKVDAL
jgi:8-oxo-dGTP pyrophosphatase MutT (NUDIX family)